MIHYVTQRCWYIPPISNNTNIFNVADDQLSEMMWWCNSWWFDQEWWQTYKWPSSASSFLNKCFLLIFTELYSFIVMSIYEWNSVHFNISVVIIIREWLDHKTVLISSSKLDILCKQATLHCFYLLESDAWCIYKQTKMFSMQTLVE